MKKSQAGFTLVELTVSIAAAALVFAAVSAFMLLGLRLGRGGADTSAERLEGSIIMRSLENLAAGGNIGEPVYGYGELDWLLCREGLSPEDGALLSFDRERAVIFGSSGAPLLENIKEASLKYEDDLLILEAESLRGEKYFAAVYCRPDEGETVIWQQGDE